MPVNIAKTACLLLTLKRTAANAPDQAPVIGIGIETNNIRPMIS